MRNISIQALKLKRKVLPILKRHEVKRAAIFGSFAKGEMKKNSDLDILIEFKGEKSLLDLAGLKVELEEILKMNVDIVEYSTIHPLLKDQILKEQVPIR